MYDELKSFTWSILQYSLQEKVKILQLFFNNKRQHLSNDKWQD